MVSAAPNELSSAFRQLADGSRDGVVILDAALRCRYANAAAATLIGLPAQDPDGCDFLGYFPEGERDALASALAGRSTCTWSSVLRVPGSGERAVELCVQEIPGEPLALVTLNDVTEVRRVVRKAAAVAQIAASMAYAGTLDATLEALARGVVQAAGIRACSVILLEDNHRVRLAGSYGLPAEYVTRLQAVWDAGKAQPVVLRAVEKKEVAVIPDVPAMLLADQSYAPMHEIMRTADWRTMVAVPLIYQTQVLGTLATYWPPGGEPNEAEIAFLETIADQAAVAVQNARLAAEAQRQAALAERRHSEEQLRERAAQYESIFGATIDGIVINDLETGLVVEANAAYCRMHGYSHDEVIGLHTDVLVQRDYHQDVEALFRTIRSGGTFQARGVNIRKDGSTFPVEVHGTSFSYQGKPHVLAVVRDITERIEAERQLREQEQEYRSIFEATSDHMFIVDTDGYVVEANPAACEMNGYTREEVLARRPRLLSDKEIRTLETTGHFHDRTINYRKDGTPYYSEGRVTRFTYKGKPHYLVVGRDVTEQVRAYELLEQRVEERTRELQTLLEVSRNVTSTLELGPLFELIFDQLKVMTEYSGVALLGLEGDKLVVMARRAPGPDPQSGPAEYSMASAQPILDRLREGKPVIMDDVRGDDPLAVAYRASIGDRLDTEFPHEESLMAVPMMVKDRVMGALAISSARLGYFTEHHAGLVQAIANQAAVAIENARLYEQEQVRGRELTTLLEVSRDVTSTLEVQPLLNLILEQIKRVVDFADAGILRLEGEELQAIAYSGPLPQEIALQLRFPVDESLPTWPVITYGETIIIDDVRGDSPLAVAYRRSVGDEIDRSLAYVSSHMAVPMTLGERVIGAVAVSHSVPNFYTPRHAALVLGIAQQAAIAIENARLYEQAQEVAALEERQRLARELHDSVSQALYGIALGAQTTRALLDRDPGRAAESLDYVLTQAEAGLAEMRALIFELRPDALETEGLVSALDRQLKALSARHGITVDAALVDEPELALATKEALYRIAQEAMHNTVKHAKATEVRIRLDRSNGHILLELRDNGRGFDPTGSFPGHLGLHTMRERAVRLGGSFEVESHPGRGTRIQVRIPSSAS